MTTSQRLWLGFGALTALMVVVCVAVLLGVRSIENAMQDQADVGWPRSEATQELEINVLGYALAMRTFFRTEDPKFRQEALEDAADVERYLREYQRLARTERQQQFAARFAALWRNYQDFSLAIINLKDRSVEPVDLQRLIDLRIELETFLKQEMQPAVIKSYEVRREAMFQALRTIVTSILILLIVGLVMALLISQAFNKAIVRGEKIIAEQAERLKITFASIGDAIIVTDTTGRITNMNAVAESLTGWTKGEALGQPLNDVFRIVNEQTRQPVENPATRALHEGVIVGLANHTVLISKDGTEYFIDDSAAPIKDQTGKALGVVLIFRDISDRYRAEQTLRYQYDLTKAITDNATTAIFMMDQQSRCTFMNPAAEAMTGFSLEETQGRILHDLIHHTRPDGTPYPMPECPIDRALPEKNKVKGHEDLFVRKNGEFFPVTCSALPIYEEGIPIGTVIEVRDITQEKEAEKQVYDLLDERYEADRRKDEFLAMLAHELRNPLAPISHSLELMKAAKGNIDLMEQIRLTMDRQIAQMVRLVDDLLDVSRITRNKLELKKERLELASIMRYVVETCLPFCDRAGHHLNIILPSEPIYLYADSMRLAQVFGNLLNNTSKYTEPGGRISLIVERQGSEVAVKVKDTGVGIPSEMLLKVFDLFTQVDRSLERSTGGLGIGLSLVKRLVEMHGGTVTAYSEGQDRGSEFVVRLPILTEAPADQTLPEPTSQPITTTTRRILVVDDNRDSADSLAMLLQLTGNEIQTAYDGVEAVEKATAFRPDVILMDIGLPKMNGYDACRAIREQPWGKDIVMVALTGWGQDEDRRKSNEAGFNGHMVKPVDYAALMQLLASVSPTA